MHIEEALQDYIHYIQAVDQKSLTTINSYRQDLKIYISYLKENQINDMNMITYSNIQDFLQREMETKKASSLNRMISSIRNFHHYITFAYPKIQDPSIHLKNKKVALKLPNYLNQQDMQKLLDSFTEDEQGIFEHAVFELLYGCGLRVSELCNLQLIDLHLQQGFLKIQGKGDKQRMIPLHEKGIQSLNLYLHRVRSKWEKKKTGYVFINALSHPVSRQYIHRMVKSKLYSLGLNQNLSTHSFRHSFASHLLDEGANLRIVQELLGHSDIKTTQIYTHIQNKRLKEAYTKFHPRNNRKEDIYE